MTRVLTALVSSVMSSDNPSDEAKTRGAVDVSTDILGTAERSSLQETLAQKENDLILAAELGKALLEKNEELRRQNEDMAEGYAERLEVGSISLSACYSLP